MVGIVGADYRFEASSVRAKSLSYTYSVSCDSTAVSFRVWSSGRLLDSAEVGKIVTKSSIYMSLV